MFNGTRSETVTIKAINAPNEKAAWSTFNSEMLASFIIKAFGVASMKPLKKAPKGRILLHQCRPELPPYGA